VFLSSFAFGQKTSYIILENNKENSIFFDETNPNSLISHLQRQTQYFVQTDLNTWDLCIEATIGVKIKYDDRGNFDGYIKDSSFIYKGCKTIKTRDGTADNRGIKYENIGEFLEFYHGTFDRDDPIYDPNSNLPCYISNNAPQKIKDAVIANFGAYTFTIMEGENMDERVYTEHQANLTTDENLAFTYDYGGVQPDPVDAKYRVFLFRNGSSFKEIKHIVFKVTDNNIEQISLAKKVGNGTKLDIVFTMKIKDLLNPEGLLLPSTQITKNKSNQALFDSTSLIIKKAKGKGIMDINMRSKIDLIANAKSLSYNATIKNTNKFNSIFTETNYDRNDPIYDPNTNLQCYISNNASQEIKNEIIANDGSYQFTVLLNWNTDELAFTENQINLTTDESQVFTFDYGGMQPDPVVAVYRVATQSFSKREGHFKELDLYTGKSIEFEKKNILNYLSDLFISTRYVKTEKGYVAKINDIGFGYKENVEEKAALIDVYTLKDNDDFSSCFNEKTIYSVPFKKLEWVKRINGNKFKNAIKLDAKKDLEKLKSMYYFKLIEGDYNPDTRKQIYKFSNAPHF